jgi:predicted GNAT family N-acyltransferase
MTIAMGHLKIIEYGSEAYCQAALLRYRLFYEEHGVPFEAIGDPLESHDLHVAVMDEGGDRVMAYGRLGQRGDEWQIYQMVVEPEYQGLGLGRRILQALVDGAIERGASCLVLNARVTKVGFYERFGFEVVGNVFVSAVTGVAHVQMRRG